MSTTKNAEGDFCAVKWQNSSTIVVVPTSAVIESSESIRLNGIYTIELNGWHRKGEVILKGKLDLYTIAHYVFNYCKVLKLNATLYNMINLHKSPLTLLVGLSYVSIQFIN